MKYALLQLNYKVGDLCGNRQKIFDAAVALKDQKVDLIVASEMALTGYPPKDLLLGGAFVQRAKEELEGLAHDLKDCPPVLIGSIEINPGPKGKRLFNAGFLLQNGKIAATVRKRLLPNYDVFDENRYFESSKSSQVIDLNGRKIGVTVCEDIWNDDEYLHPNLYEENPLDELRENKVQALINLSSSPFTIGKQIFREAMLSKIAQKSGFPVICVNQVGGNDDLVFDGNSCVFDNKGQLIARACSFEEDSLVFELKEGKTARIEPELGYEEKILGALVLGTRDYVKKCGFHQAVIGLSGGIDSSLTAFVAKEALGADNVLGVLMPSPYSSESSITDAQDLADNLGIPIRTLPIRQVMEAFDKTLSHVFDGFDQDITEENIQARIRGNLLMALSNKLGAILLTTGNKSELAVGYCTIYGDMSGGLAVISDLPKTLVYKLSDWINRQYGDCIPENVLQKAPSAELRPDQTDQDSLPPYEELDRILLHLIEQRLSPDEIAQEGFELETVLKVAHLVSRAEFKRQQAAPGIKITDQAFGTGWRMPLAAKHLF